MASNNGPKPAVGFTVVRATPASREFLSGNDAEFLFGLCVTSYSASIEEREIGGNEHACKVDHRSILRKMMR